MFVKRAYFDLVKRLIRIICLHLILKQLDEESNIQVVKRSIMSLPTTIIRASAIIRNFQNRPSAISLGEYTILEGEVTIFSYGGNLSVGDWCFIGNGTQIWSAEKISIGNNVLISHNVFISDTNAHEVDFQERACSYHKLLLENHPKLKPNVASAPITIEDNVWINPNAIILKGVTIGKGSIIAAGSVVVKSIAPFSFVAGNPASIIKSLK